MKLTSLRSPSSTLTKQWASVWSWIMDWLPGAQQRIIWNRNEYYYSILSKNMARQSECLVPTMLEEICVKKCRKTRKGTRAEPLKNLAICRLCKLFMQSDWGAKILHQSKGSKPAHQIFTQEIFLIGSCYITYYKSHEPCAANQLLSFSNVILNAISVTRR